MHWSDIHGWLTEAEGAALQHLAAGATVLELGSFLGRSTVCLAQAAAHVVSIDRHTGDEGTGPADTLAGFWRNLQEFGVRDRVTVVAAGIEAAARWLPEGAFGLAFVDAAHDAASVERDCRLACRCLRKGGVIALHDWNDARVRTGAGRAGVVPRHFVGTLAWV